MPAFLGGGGGGDFLPVAVVTTTGFLGGGGGDFLPVAATPTGFLGGGGGGRLPPACCRLRPVKKGGGRQHQWAGGSGWHGGSMVTCRRPAKARVRQMADLSGAGAPPPPPPPPVPPGLRLDSTTCAPGWPSSACAQHDPAAAAGGGEGTGVWESGGGKLGLAARGGGGANTTRRRRRRNRPVRAGSVRCVVLVPPWAADRCCTGPRKARCRQTPREQAPPRARPQIACKRPPGLTSESQDEQGSEERAQAPSGGPHARPGP